MTTPPPTVWPALRAADAPARVRWLVDVLGRPLQQTAYGAQESTVRDPEGDSWSGGDHRGAPRD
ncbi:hypothetical protein [Geodermatophilus sp. DSM 44513]|uniref:hypothetical protein n=1 Tax=Geodermatophilus sp. DSM 44513 TaxID=1528104 RepID=UPI001275E538|nr:hypothetical protein [Geodermatophilus sp. DSM 44513]WNV75620.1 hypothetical protein RTG05_21980 [Geodermatophilus sp. DSM 44513]